MPTNLTPVSLTTTFLVAAGPDEALRVQLSVSFAVNDTVAILVPFIPGGRVPIPFQITCKRNQKTVGLSLSQNARWYKNGTRSVGLTFMPDTITCFI